MIDMMASQWSIVMEPKSKVLAHQQDYCAPLHHPDAVFALRPVLSQTELEHAARNVTEWRRYLPEDCVKLMIRMGWDYTT